MKLPEIYTAYFNKDCQVNLGNKITTLFHKKSLCAIPYFTNKDDIDRLAGQRLLEIFSLDKVTTRYDISQGRKILFTHIGGGLGDIIAYSAIAAYLKDYPLTVYIDSKHFPLLQWWSHKVTKKDYYAPIFERYSPIDLKIHYKDYRRLYMEYAAIEGGTQCWYDSMFKRIGLPGAPEGFARPQLIQPIFIERQVPHNSILIKHKSSCQMRSSLLEDFYRPVREAYPKHKIYVDALDLRNAEDIAFVNRKDISINIIAKQSLDAHLISLAQFGNVVSTDSYAIHFREGIGKPAVGVYGAIAKESRTSGYKHTLSFNTVSDCKYQPCYIHETIKGLVCPNYKGGARVAPCQSGEAFQAQLLAFLRDNK